MPILELQKRARELGRIRIGVKETFTKRNGDPGTRPAKLDRFRLTSASKPLLEKVGELYGGEVREWTPDGGSPQWEVITSSARLPIMVPPQPVTQWHEAWRKSGCVHRCDGRTNVLTDEPCDPEDPLHQEALTKPTTRLNVILRDVEGIGVWRVETHGWNAAIELPDVAEFLSRAGGYVNGWLALEQRTSVDNSGPKPVTRHYMVPIIEVDVTPAQLMAGQGRVAAPALEGPVRQPVTGQEERQAITSGQDAYAPFFDLVEGASTLEELAGIWDQAKAQRLVGSESQPSPRGVEFFEAFKARGHKIKAQLDAAQSDGTGQAPAGEQPVDDGPDADAVWREIVATAGTLDPPMSTSQLREDFEKRAGVSPEQASAGELAAYLAGLREQAGVAA